MLLRNDCKNVTNLMVLWEDIMKVLETKRMLLRPWTIEDLDDFYEYAKNPKVGPNAGWEPHKDKGISLGILQSFIKNDEVRAIVYKENNKVIGSLGVHSDRKREGVQAKMIGYVLSESYWGKGLMSEAVKETIRYLFEEERIDIVSCYHYPSNIRSKRVIEKSRFKYEGTLRLASKIYDGSVCDDICYSITREDYLMNSR
jgi:putative acetyltransferase